MVYSDPGQIVAAVILFIVGAWLLLKAGQWIIQSARTVMLVAQKETEEIPDKLNSQLNSPAKRLGACIAAVGLLSIAVGVIQIAMDASYFKDAVRNFYISAIWIVTDHPYRAFKAISYGVPMVIGGMAFSFFYDAGIGKVVRWILHGRGHPQQHRT